MYDPVYGNHIGVVINNQDPENRGRLQIFIPHLSNNLLPTWNTNLEDISFKSTEVDAKLGSVLERLKNTLPWAETAVPSFGGGTAGPTKYDGNSSPLPLVPNAAGMIIRAKEIQTLNNGNGNGQSFDRTDQGIPKTLDEVPDGVLRYIAGIGATESGVFLDDNATGRVTTEAYNIQRNIDNTRILGIAGKTWDQLTPAQRDEVDSGFFQNSPKNIRDNSNINLTNRGTLEQQTLSIARLLYSTKRFRPAYEYAKNNDFKPADVIVAGLNTGSGFYNGPRNQPNEAAKARNLSAQEIRDYIKKFDSNPDNLKKQNEQLAGATGEGSRSSPIRMTDSLAAEGGVGSPSGGGAAAGFFSKPAIGAKVWVFFHGGDVQRPVYFASVMEPANYEVANQTVATSG